MNRTKERIVFTSSCSVGDAREVRDQSFLVLFIFFSHLSQALMNTVVDSTN